MVDRHGFLPVIVNSIPQLREELAQGSAGCVFLAPQHPERSFCSVLRVLAKKTRRVQDDAECIFRFER
jgi:hypothetical protein